MCGSSLEVCKDMFLNTLGISQKVIERVCINGKENSGITTQIIKPRNPRQSKGFTRTEEDQFFLKEFFEKIPKSPGHYCHRFKKGLSYTCCTNNEQVMRFKKRDAML